MPENMEALKVVAVWAALNFAWMFALAVNTYRTRSQENIYLGIAAGNEKLERAIRAHGNNTEYVPSILLGLLFLALLGENQTLLHGAGAVLLTSRVLHAIGMQQTHKEIPLNRILGNVLCWLLYLAIMIRMLMLSL
ncbi:MAPEG family protein [Bacterioplanoides sp.]|uniref:MAPEG family protein n=1 Tax=Bacterioplanoides sp. TaxID=2066072 RepID=UPI003AFF9FBB